MLKLKLTVIVQHSVVCQCKGRSASFPGERMIILVLAGAALGSHTSMAHDVPDLRGDAVLHLMGRLRCFLDTQSVPLKEGNAGGIRTAYLSSGTQRLD